MDYEVLHLSIAEEQTYIPSHWLWPSVIKRMRIFAIGVFLVATRLF